MDSLDHLHPGPHRRHERHAHRAGAVQVVRSRLPGRHRGLRPYAAYQLPPITDEQRKAIEETLLRLEVERGERIKQSKEAAAKQEAAEKGTPKRAPRRTWLRDRTRADMDEPAAEGTPGEAPGDIQ